MSRNEPTGALRVATIIGSTREGRAGAAIGEWFAEVARQRTDIEISVLDLAAFAFPARLPETPTADMRRFAGSIEEADAFVVVTPEYNRSFPASLKQAIDYAYDEWHGKPAGFVSYGCRSEGFFAVEQLRAVFTELHVVTMRDTVSFNLFGPGIDEKGRPPVRGELAVVADAMLDQLTWWGRALRNARAAEPYTC
ncbi:NADPH-dependent FMN reductase [Prauserella marina]|uniref:NAD(P)H-dependent FMN reductase n=1 Tax=Prauserella marina TaxID=530584 RepID=A0A222VPX5_9PSEU|nr:NAD(P)H-dependent oxidoreductase [Prauserella marina]ASR35976.1 NADPH-dependent FMN reductase [Prauserella marina]PWV84081.1 NAD(P)H-dependent FMN reductase [Prauserella marina]SDC30848.1 NAD(P)H-dependent FMN reductase [Prauserella marina]